MSGVDLLCAAPAYLDLTFTGLQRLPRTGREEFASGLTRSPGGGALNAIGAARLGLATAAAFCIGDDEAGEFLRIQLTREGVALMGATRGRTPVTVVLPVGGDRAFVTYDPSTPVDLLPLAALRPERVFHALGQFNGVMAGARSFVSLGDREASRYAEESLPELAAGATVFVNVGEAEQVTGRSTPHDAARALADWAEVVVVTQGEHGALACSGSELVDGSGIEVDVVDTTGAGDLFAAAWIWGDARGLDLEARLNWAVLYAALSVTVPTGAAGAVDLDTLLAVGSGRGFPAPCSAGLTELPA